MGICLRFPRHRIPTRAGAPHQAGRGTRGRTSASGTTASPSRSTTPSPPRDTSPSSFAAQVAFFYVSLYLVAFTYGGQKPCVQGFSVEQFDENDPRELASRGSFFNWFFFITDGSLIITVSALNYVQDSVSWQLGFRIPAVTMALALAVFLFGTKTYRFYPPARNGGLLARLGERLAATTVRSWHSPWRSKLSDSSRPLLDSSPSSPKGSTDNADADFPHEAASLLRLFPIWSACLIYAAAYAQWATFFTKQPEGEEGSENSPNDQGDGSKHR